jgi:isopenicillin N synthase-like dioxygenase
MGDMQEISEEARQAQRQIDAGTDIPIVDIGPYLRGEPGSLERTAKQVGAASESLGFFYLLNHEVPQELIDRVFEQTERFHSLPEDRKMEVKVLSDNLGYLPLGGQTQRTYQSLYGQSKHPDLSASFFARKDYPADHPDRIAGRPWVYDNRWPRDLPGFREVLMEYFDTLTMLAEKVLELQSVALGMPKEFIPRHEAFSPPVHILRLLHYPPRNPALDGQFGIGAHTDYGYGSILAQANVPGLEIYTREGTWVEAPALPGHLLFNNGDMCKVWTNDRFRSAPHRVINKSGKTRYSIPFFVSTRFDVKLECIPSCHGPGNPPKYAPISYGEHFARLRAQNYDLPK